MKIDYQLKQFTKQENVGYIAVLVPKGKVTTALTIERISSRLTISQNIVDAVLGEYMNQVEGALKQGYRVELGNMGYFSLGISSRFINNPKNLRAESINLKRIKFSPNRKFMAKMKDEVNFRRAKVTKLEPLDVRSAQFLDFLEEKKIFNRKDYMKLTGCSVATAARDLKTYCKMGLIHSPYLGIYEKLERKDSSY